MLQIFSSYHSRIDSKFNGLVKNIFTGRSKGRRLGSMADKEVLESVSRSLFKESPASPTEFQIVVKGHSFTPPGDKGATVDYHALLQSFRTTGFQATNFGLAVEEINRMVRSGILVYVIIIFWINV